MLETIKKEWQAKVIIGLLILLTLWFFISPQISTTENGRFFGDFPSIYGVMALWGGYWGLKISLKWGFTKSIMGKSQLFFALGLFAQVFGQVVYAYFSFFKQVEVPYPSLGDVGYFGSIPLYFLGTMYLAQASGVQIGLKSLARKIQAVIIPVLMVGFGYALFLQNYSFDFSDPLRIFLDFGYPLGQAVYIALAILTFSLSRGILGGIMKNKIFFILLALIVQFLADYVFLFQAYYELWSVGGWNDYMYLIAYFLMAIGLLQFKTTFDSLHSGHKSKD